MRFVYLFIGRCKLVYNFHQQYQFLTIPKGQGPSAANNYTLKYTMAKDLDETFKDNLNDVSRWQMQFGIKYIF